MRGKKSARVRGEESGGICAREEESGGIEQARVKGEESGGIEETCVRGEESRGIGHDTSSRESYIETNSDSEKYASGSDSELSDRDVRMDFVGFEDTESLRSSDEENFTSEEELQGKIEQQQTYWSLQGCSVLNLMYKYNRTYQSNVMIERKLYESK